MLVLRVRRATAPRARRGAALMLSVLVLLVLVAVVFQINVATSTDARVARNDVSLTAMDLAVESALLMKFDQLVQDAEAGAEGGAGGGAAGGLGGGLGGGMGGGMGGGLGGGLGGGAGGEGGGGASGPVDSREDPWAEEEVTDAINELRMRVLVQDENSKYNVLSMLDPDPARAEKAFRRVVRIIDLFREGTEDDVDTGSAERMAEVMLDHLRLETDLSRPRLLTDDPDAEFETKPMLSLRELTAYPEFEPILFRDFRTEDDQIVHSLTSYLTVWSAVQTRQAWQEAREAEPGGQGGGGGGGQGDDANGGGGGQAGGGGQGSQGGVGVAGGGGGGGSTTLSGQAGAGNAGGAQGLGGGGPGGAGGANGGNDVGRVNLNTAPPVVLKGLMDEGDVDPRFWDEVLVYRNEEDETQVDPDAEPVYDAFGEERVPNQIFESVEGLSEVRDWDLIEPEAREALFGLVGVASDVFTIYVTVQRSTSRADQGAVAGTLTREEFEEQLHAPTNLTRTVACTVWRRSGEEGFELVPLQRWEYLDYIPYQVLDFPEEGR